MSTADKSPRQGRDRQLSLKGSENFERSRQTLLENINSYCKKIDQCITELEDPDDMVLARKNVQKAHFNHERYISSCEKLLTLYTSTGTTESLSLHEQLVEDQAAYSAHYHDYIDPLYKHFDCDNWSQYAPTEPSQKVSCLSNGGSHKSSHHSSVGSHKSSDSQLATRLAAADAAEAKARLEAIKRKTALSQKQANFEADKLKDSRLTY